MDGSNGNGNGHELPPLLKQMYRERFPTPAAITEQLALWQAELELPLPTVHVISDIHGEDAKLRHVLQNASGTLRTLVEALFADLAAADRQELLGLLFYPQEMLEQLRGSVDLARDPLRGYGRRLTQILTLIRTLGKRFTQREMLERIPAPYRTLLAEMIHGRSIDRDEPYVQAMLRTLIQDRRIEPFLEQACQAVSDLTTRELVAAGDFWDRGPRGDRVMDALMRQPNVSITWGNHDMAWLGAGLGHEALIAHVLRISLRYRRLRQLEEGYGIPIQPLEHFARMAYGDDPADCFRVKGTGLRDDLLMARMQKAAAIIQFKLEGPMLERHPEWGLDDRRLLHRLNRERTAVTIAGQQYALRDHHFPTIDPADPYRLTPDEAHCLARIRESFLCSEKLAKQLEFLVRRGGMWVVRDDHLIFHGCIACDAAGGFLPVTVDGQPLAGRALFEEFEKLVPRAWSDRKLEDLDWLWYLWCGPLSPLFGKDKIATFEIDLAVDEAIREEHKNPYFALLHEREFCRKVLREFGVNPERGMIVNGHVPVKIEQGESPLKRSGMAVTIDGAFSEAYGDRGYTLVIESTGTYLAEHHHFESVEAAIRDGQDIVPTIHHLRSYDPPRRVADCELGTALREQCALLERNPV